MDEIEDEDDGHLVVLDAGLYILELLHPSVHQHSPGTFLGRITA